LKSWTAKGREFKKWSLDNFEGYLRRESIMPTLTRVRMNVFLIALMVACNSTYLLAQSSATGAKTEVRKSNSQRDCQHDFDFEFGTWKTHLRRQLHPLSGSNTWVEYEGTTTVR